MNLMISELNSLREQGLYREITTLAGIDFCTNDYLGFIRSDKISPLLFTAKSGAGASRLIPGFHEAAIETENFLSQVYNIDSVLFFGSGYLANIGIIQALANEDTEFFSDEFNHASIIDGMKLVKSKKQIFRHNNLSHLEEILKKSFSKQKCVITESIFSMDGDSPDLKELIKLCEKYDAFLVVDEAHATGVVGKNGLGLMEDFQYNKEKTIIVHTCGKAIGCYGAFVISGKIIRELLINKARTLIYSTALSPYIFKQIHFAINEVIKSGHLRTQIATNIQYAKEQFKKKHLKLSGSHISYIEFLNSNKCPIQIEQQLKEKGLNVKGIRYPSVPKGQERLRITIKSFNSQLEIQKLAITLKDILQ
ncbi:MAG: pyridoxal phosphate-dependent aminotransferase family protein [Bacteriovorax sp.]|nr:pyridoxal phosphate-dependent aminotransferase family protein [Bacteriovorax sp.]